MLKLSRKGYGLLNAQYRSVLRKCLFLNIVAAALLISPTAYAAGVAADSNSDIRVNLKDSSDLTTVKEYLASKMGLIINGEESAISALYVHGDFTGDLYSQENANYSWLLNQGTVQVGYIYQNGVITEASSQTVISGRHNTAADTIYSGGGAIVNGGKTSDDAVLKIRNTLFTDNTASSFLGYTAAGFMAAGGAVANFSTENAEISGSVFRGNYVMGTTNLAGGAVYNGTLTDSSNDVTGQGLMTSTSNQYINNYVGNQTSNTTLQGLWTTAGGGQAPTAGGGAIYNTGTFTSDGDTFTTNHALADKASGGAIYNGLSVLVESGGDLTLRGIVKFEGNYAQSTAASGGMALGGAIANNRNITSNGATLTFLNNYVTAVTNAQGGAIYNGADGKMNLDGTFTGNTATITNGSLGTSAALGGAVANFGTGVVNNGTYNNNHAYSNGTGASLAAGGAIANSGGITSSGRSFSANSAEVKAGSAFGGALANAGTYATSGDVYSGNAAVSAQTAGGTELNRAFGGAVYNGVIQGGENASFTVNGSARFSENSATAAFAAGGAVLNNQTGTFTANGSNYSIEFTNNHVTGGTLIASGGAIGNLGTMSVSGGKFSGNYAEGTMAVGGAVANMIENTTASVSAGLFEDNKIITSSHGLGGAFYNSNVNALTTLTDDSFVGNFIQINETAGGSVIAQGGAVYNNGAASQISRMKIQTQNQDVSFENNKITVGTSAANVTESFAGGAVYNGSYGQLTIENATAGRTITFSGNTAQNGGAVFNEASGANVVVDGNSITSYLAVNAVSGNIEFIANSAEENGGALNNQSTATGTASISAANASVHFNQNTAQQGGAVYNAGGGTVLMQLGEQGTVSFAGNQSTGIGGGILNADSKIKIENTGTANSSNLIFGGNKASSGAAVYNQGTGSIEGTLKKAAVLSFDGNTAASGLGGAIYNEQNATINIALADTAKIIFNTTSDDVYNLGEVTITGDSPASSLTTNYKSGMAFSEIKPQAANNSLTQIVLNSTFGGTGKYNISDTQLNLGTSGYIDYDPVMNLSNNTINLASGSFINLNTEDTLVNNNFDISHSATVTYHASADKPDIALANNMINSGTLDVRDGIVSKVEINTLTSNDGTIRIDVDNPSYTADVITINNRIYGTTNVVFDNQTTLTLEDQKIYFAQTQTEQALSEYSFKTFVVNNLYEIKVGYEENGAVYDWYLYRDTDALAPEVIAYIDLPRSAIEQTRSILFDISRTNKGVCDCRRGICTNNIYCKYGSADAKSRLWAKPVYRTGTFDRPVETDLTVYGIDFGFDYQPSHSDMFGIFGSYRNGKYENDGKGKEFYSNQGSKLEISSILAGLYYRKYFGNLYMNGTIYGGQQDVDVKADNDVSASVKGLNLGAEAEIGYDIRTTRRSVLTPSVKATYDYIKFDDLTDSSLKHAEFENIHDIELEAGIKFEYQFNNERQLPTTAYIKPSVVQMLSSGGKVTVAGKEFDKTLEDETLGRVEIGADAELIENFSVGAFGNYTFGSAYNAWGIGGNIKYVW